MSEFWVFGYGSLMWRPGFPFEEVIPAILHGEHRALCVFSWVHRGTKEKPGLVLGLDRGGACRGLAFRVAAPRRDEVLAYLRARELVTNVYLEVTRSIRLERAGNPAVRALTFVCDRTHEQYAGTLDRDAVLALVANSEGVSGHNRDYVTATAEQLLKSGIRDPLMIWLAEKLLAEPRAAEAVSLP